MFQRCLVVLICRSQRGYRRVSQGSKEKDVLTKKHQPVNKSLIAPERYAYMLESRQSFKECSILSLAVDAVHIGDYEWLLVAAYNPANHVAALCPPQAGSYFLSTNRARIAGKNDHILFDCPENMLFSTIPHT